MKNSITSTTPRGLAIPAAVALLIAATPAFAQSTSRMLTTTTTNQSPNTLTVVSSESLDGAGDDDASVKSETFEIRVEDGKVSVRQNGKDIPDARIVRKDGRVIILDENGKELRNIKLGLFNSPGGYFYRMGEVDHAGNPDIATLYPRLLTGAGALRGVAVPEAGDQGEAPKVMIGVHMGEPGAALEKHLHLDAGKSTMITGVYEGLPAEQAGIGEYDIIVSVDGSDSADAQTVRETLQKKDPGDTVTLRVIQAGKQKDIKIRLDGYDAQKMQSAKLIGEASNDALLGGAGMHLDRFFNNDGQNWPGRIWVAPDGGEQLWQGVVPQLDQMHLEGLKPEQWEKLQPMIDQHLRDALKQYHVDQGAGEGGSDVEKQLDRLDERLSQLEKMLQKLVEKQAKP
jgi:hypothetical protein